MSRFTRNENLLLFKDCEQQQFKGGKQKWKIHFGSGIREILNYIMQ